jgi:hypothetical protein
MEIMLDMDVISSTTIETIETTIRIEANLKLQVEGIIDHRSSIIDHHRTFRILSDPWTHGPPFPRPTVGLLTAVQGISLSVLLFYCILR